MTQPVSSGSEGTPGKNRPVYGTQFSSFGSDRPPQPDLGADDRVSSAGRKTDSNQSAFGTQVAQPVHQLVNRQPQQPEDLPSHSAFREVMTTRRAEVSQLNLLTQIAADQKQKADPSSRGAAGKEQARFFQATMLVDPCKTDTPRSVSEEQAGDHQARMQRGRGVGKSTWNLRIHRRDVSGAMPEISEPRADLPEGTTSLHSAFSDDENAPEYEVLKELAAGNMGVVYHARQLSLNRELAIKTLKPSSSHADHDQAMFVSEAVVTANLVHPNIVPIHDLGRTEDGRLFYSMKKVIGVPWHHDIRQRSLEDNLEIFMKLCDAVAYAHSRGVVNRDLKPENVIVGEYGEVIVLDWGLAITTERFEKRKSVLVDFRGGCGTPVYMAPELLDEDIAGVGPHSDIYLLGAILFEVIEGFPPHLLRRYWNLSQPGDQLNGVVMAVMNNEIEEDIAHPGELMQIARKAMSTSPSYRYPSVEAFQEAIREYRITGRGEELLNSVDPRSAKDYTSYQSAVALYGEALRKWPANQRAMRGDQKARLAYAQLALRMGDVDLGLQVVGDQSDESFHSVVSKLKKTRLVRKVVRATWGVTTVAAVSLMIVSYLLMLGAENSKQEALVAKEVAVKAKEKTDETLAVNIRLNGDKEKLQEDNDKADKAAKNAQALAKAEGSRAADETEKANKAKKDAETAKAMAAEETKKANDATAKAVEAKELAAMEMERAKKATESADKATAMLATVKDDADRARQEKYQSEVDGYDSKIEAGFELGDYHDVIRIIKEELTKAEQNPLIKKRESLLKEKLKNAEENVGNAEINLDGKPDSASISTDGSTVVMVLSRGAEKHVGVLRNDSGLHASRPIPIAILLGLKGDVKVSVSGDGKTFCLLGKSERQFWQLKDKSYELMTVDGEPGGEVSPSFGWGLFSQNGQHLYLIGSDKKATVDVFAIGQGTAKRLIRQPLARGSQADYRIRDVVLLPRGERSALIAEFETQPCRQYWIQWKGAEHPVFETLSNEAPPRGPLQLSGEENLSKADRLCLSPDAKQLAFVFSKTVVILPAIDDSSGKVFSFAALPEVTKTEASLTVFRSTMRITDMKFSGNGQRIATGHANRYIQIWDRVNGSFVPCTATDSLFTHRPSKSDSVFATCLRGHSKGIKSFQFADGDPDRLISAGLDQSVRTWQISRYSDLVKKMGELSRAIEEVATSPDSTTDIRNTSPANRGHGEQRSLSQVARLKHFRRDQYFLTGAGPQPPRADDAQEQKPEFRNIYSAKFSPDGSRLLIGTDDLAAHVVDSRTGKRIHGAEGGRRDLFFDPERNLFSEGHLSQISSVQFLPPNGELLLSADYFGSISVWDALDDGNGLGFERSRLLSEYPLSEFAVSADGSLVLAGGAVTSDPNAILEKADVKHVGMLWRTVDIMASPTPSPALILDKQHLDSAITAVGISETSKRLVTAGRRGKIVVWDATNGSVIATASESHNRDQVAGIFFESESQLVSAGYDGRIYRWIIQGTELVATEIVRGADQKSPGFIVRLRPAPDRKRFATSEVVMGEAGSGSSQLSIMVWSQDSARPLLSKGIAIPKTDKEKAFRHDVSWSSDGKELMLVQDGTIRVFSTTDWKLLRKLKLNSVGASPIRGAFAPAENGASTKVATFDGRFTHLWNLETKKHLTEFRSHAGYNVTASFSADQKFVATASETLRLFNADEGSPNHGRTIFRLNLRESQSSPLSDVAFSPAPGDSRLVTVDTVGRAEIWKWQPEAESPLLSLAKSSPPAAELPAWMNDRQLMCGNAAAWSSDGKSLATLQMGVLSLLRFTENNLVRVEFPVPEGLECRFNQLDFSEKNNLVVAGGIAWNEANSELSSFAAVWDVNGDTPRLAATLGADHSVDRYTREPQRISSNDSELRRTGITAIAIDEARNRIISGGADGRLILWGLTGLNEGSVSALGVINDLKQKGVTANAHDSSISCIDLNSASQIVTADQSGVFILWKQSEE